MKQTFCIGNQDGIIAVICPKCDTPMTLMDGGYSERFVDGEYDQVENHDYWECPNCGMTEDE